MNLGAQLKAAQAHHDEAARLAALEKQRVAEEARLLFDLEVRHFFNYAFSLFEFRLKHGQLPGTVSLGGRTFRDAANLLRTVQWVHADRPDPDWRNYCKGVWTPGREGHELWLEFEARCAAAGLDPKWMPCHDGIGRESWYELTVVAA